MMMSTSSSVDKVSCSSSNASSSSSFPNLKSYIQDTVNKIENKDPMTRKRILDEFHFPTVDWDGDESLDEPMMIQIMDTAAQAIMSSAVDDGNDTASQSPLQELELKLCLHGQTLPTYFDINVNIDWMLERWPKD